MRAALDEDLQELSRRHDGNAKGFPEHQQVWIPRDDETGSCRERAAKHLVVFRITTALLANGGWLNLFGFCNPPVHDRPGIAGKLVARMNPARLADQLIEQARRRENGHLAVCGRHKATIGLVSPTRTGQNDIRIEDGPHFWRLR